MVNGLREDEKAEPVNQSGKRQHIEASLCEKLPRFSKKPRLSDGDLVSAAEPLRLKQFSDPDMPSCIGYHIRNGIRFLDPYWSTYRAFAKGRWIGRKMVDVFREEFLSQNVNYFKVACKLGRIRINGVAMTDPDYVFRNNDAVVHVGHRHELPVLALPIKVIADTDDMLVVNKPPSMPVHACGQYKMHTVLSLLETENGITGLRVLHRLDRTTSGLLLFAKNYETDLKFKQVLKAGRCHKEYVCKVDGVFPKDEEIVCDRPIGTLVPTMGIQCVRDDGKSAVSRFRLMWTDGKVSLVRCRIETGRTHQIRVHLQYLGYPIVGDHIYNTKAWGTAKGRHADYGKSYEQLCKDISDAHRASLWLEKVNPDYESRMKQMADDEQLEAEPEDLELEDRPEYDPICVGCNVVKRVPSMDHFMLYLHCLKYETDDWSYSTELPEWAKEPSPAKVRA